MNIDGTPYRTIWVGDDNWSVEIIDQTKLPHAFETATLRSPEDAAYAIEAMQVRGAPLIGATAAYGVALAMRGDPSDDALDAVCARLLKTRPTAVNLRCFWISIITSIFSLSCSRCSLIFSRSCVDLPSSFLYAAIVVVLDVLSVSTVL